jgi:tetratricopeptide (TPR) repeat protein/SAM-dependent methyltransferase
MPVDLRNLLAQASIELQRGNHLVAEDLYRKAAEHDPRNAEATHFLGLSLCQTGRREEGLALMRSSVRLNGAETLYRQNLGFVLSQYGLLDEAEACLREAIAVQPRASLHNFLGTVLQRRGEMQRALEAYRQALALDSSDDVLQNNLGYAHFQLGEIGEAIARYRRAIELNPGNGMAHNNLGNALHAQGQADAAVASYRRAIEVAPHLSLAHHNLGMAMRTQGRLEAAVGCFRAAMRLAPAESASWQLFAETLAGMRFHRPDPGIESDVAACLAREDVEPEAIGACAFSLLVADPAFRSLVQSAASVADGGIADWFAHGALAALQRRPLFLALIGNTVVPDPGCESFIAAVRRGLLFSWQSGRSPAPPLELACALAHHCHLGEYLLEESAAETAAVEELQREIEAADVNSDNRLRLSIYASYRPLGLVAERVPLAEAGAADSFGRLLLRQIVEPREEERLRAQIESLTPVEDPVSRAVQAQYEENPYPRWRRAPGAASPYPLGARLRTLFPHLPPELLPESPEILIAGCGTGRHAAITARLNPSSRILAIDISRASLAYALRRCSELGIANVRFAQADLLRLRAFEERFDLIECTGVLHHLRDPLEGWRALTGMLKPGGFMKIALYSETARRSVAAARAFIAERGFRTTSEGMRSARAAIVALPDGAPARPVLESPDFYTLSGCRDLLFHVQEVCFAPDRIAAALRELGLEFLGFEFDDPAVLRAYRAQCPHDRAATSLPDWARFEVQHPATFAGMYQFWVCKKRRVEPRAGS